MLCRDIVSSLNMTSEDLQDLKELPLCFQFCLSRFENYLPSDPDSRRNQLLFLFLLPMMVKLSEIGEKSAMAQVVHMMQR